MKLSVKFLLNLLALFVIGLSLSIAEALPSAPASRTFIPVMVCKAKPQSLALYEGSTLRGLHFSNSSAPALPFESPETENFLKNSLEPLKVYSSQRAQNYLKQIPQLLTQLKLIKTGELVSGHFYSEILLPTDCELKTLVILDSADNGRTLSGFLDLALWNSLDRLDQQSALLEILLSRELMNQPEDKVPSSAELSLGSRALAAYVLADQSPLSFVPSRFEIFQRIGFPYAESEAGLCIRLDRKIVWENDVPVSGFAYSSDDWLPQCSFQLNGQTLFAEGYFQTSAETQSPKILALSLTHGPYNPQYGFVDRKLSELYGQTLFFRGEEHSIPLRFFTDGNLESGVLPGAAKAQLKWQFGEVKIGFPWNGEAGQWLDTMIAFWPSGHPRRLQSVQGQVLIQGQWRTLDSKEVFVFESGQIECADFPVRTTFQKKNGGPYVLTESNHFTCFDEQGDPIEEAYTSIYTPRQNLKSYYRFEEAPRLDRQ